MNELAAKERYEVPVDIAKYLEDEDVRIELRKKYDHKKLIDDGGK